MRSVHHLRADGREDSGVVRSIEEYRLDAHVARQVDGEAVKADQ